MRAGETIPYAPEIDSAVAREMRLEGPPNRTAVAAGEGGEILGTAQMGANRAGPGSHVASATFLVDPAHQGRGVGRALVTDSLAWARCQGYRAMQFNAVVASNLPAVVLYESLGFTVIGTAPETFLRPRDGYVGLQ